MRNFVGLNNGNDRVSSWEKNLAVRGFILYTDRGFTPRRDFFSILCSGQRKLEQLANPVISQRSGEIPVTRLGPSPAQTVFHAWFQGFFTPFRMTNVQTTLDQYKRITEVVFISVFNT